MWLLQENYRNLKNKKKKGDKNNMNDLEKYVTTAEEEYDSIICPLLSMRSISKSGRTIKCVEKRCGWYTKDYKCAIKELAEED